MKRILMILALLLLFAQSVSAANNVSDINADVVIAGDGSAAITEVWEGVFDEGDEFVIPIDLSEMYLSDFTVSDSEGEYEYVSDWESLASFEEKSRKCGITRDEDGTKLRFGISSYGEKSFTVSYTLDHFAKGYNECDVADFILVAPGESQYSAKAAVSFSLGNGRTIEKDGSSVWAFGCDASVSYADGIVTVASKKALKDGEYMRVMLSLENGTVNPAVYLEEPFENKKNAVFEETGYSEESEAPVWIVIAAAVAVIAAVAIFTALKKRRGKTKK